MSFPSKVFVSLLIFLSGFCSLVYQVTWDRMARINFGGDNISSTIVAATFLLGLGLGAYLFRKWTSQPFRIYGLVEIGIGLFGLISYEFMSNLSIFLAGNLEAGIGDLEGIRYASIIGCILFLVPPCVLIGGTLPLMFNCFIQGKNFSGRTVGWLYGLNTLGATAGALAVPFVLFNNFTIPVTLKSIGVVNILIGILVIAAGQLKSSRAVAPVMLAKKRAPIEMNVTPSFNLLVTVAFVTGFITMAYQISLIRHSFSLISSSPYNLSLVLAPFLLSIGIGSLIWPRIFSRVGRPPLSQISLLLLLGIVGMLFSVVFSHLIISNGLFTPKLENIFSALAYYFVMAGPLVITMGGVFPIVCSLSADSDRDLPERTGILYIFNSAGAFAGALLAQFIGFQLIGTAWVLTLLTLAGLATAFLCSKPTHSFRKITSSFSVLALILLAGLFSTRGWSTYIHGPEIAHGATVSVVEGQTGIAAIAWEPQEDQGRLFIGGQSMGLVPNDPKTILQISTALSLPNNARVLVLGLGGSGYLRELIKDKSIVSIDIVDWSHELPQLLRTDTAVRALGDPLGDPRVRVHRGDARLAVQLFPEKQFDLAIDNLAYPTWVGATGIRSASYMANVARILKPTGSYILTTNYARWREPILAGLLAAFSNVNENDAAHVVISSQQTLRPNSEKIRQISATYAAPAQVLADELSVILTTGYKRITPQDIHAAKPLTEDRFFTEYYLTFRELFESK